MNTSLPYSAIEDEQENTKQLQKKINQRRNINQTQSKSIHSSKNKTQKKRSKKINSMLDLIHKSDSTTSQQPTPLEESFDMLKPEMQSRNDDDDEISQSDDGESTTEGFDTRNSERIDTRNRPLLDDSQAPDAVLFQNPERYNQLVKEYGKDMLQPWVYRQNQGNSHGQVAQDAQVNSSLNPQQTASEPELLQRMNYMIHLLEEQKDQKTDNVNEELILYLFLGIFVIFVTDSFTRVGKYRR
jgi:hypothetical protein